MRRFSCPVCDYPNLSEPPRSEFGGGSFEICPSCGFQFGVNDDDEGISYETWRRRWEARGMPWSGIGVRAPANWKPVAKFVAPGGAALHRAGEPAAAATTGGPPAAERKAPDQTAEGKAAAPTAAKPARKSAAPAGKARPAPKPAGKSTKPSAKKPAKKSATPSAKGRGAKKPAARKLARKRG